MESKKFNGKEIFIAAIFVASVLIMGIKFLNPTPMMIVLEENGETTINQVPGYFTYTDMVVIFIFSVTAAVSGTLLLFSSSFGATEEHGGELILEERKKRWNEISKRLKNTEQKVYEVILNSDGIAYQSEIVKKTELPKSNVSRALDLLESRGMVERRRRGMGNIILLK